MKKEKREVLLSRRRRTLRRLLIAALAVFLVNRVLLIGLLFPIQAIRHNEGGANRDLQKFADQLQALIDKWDR